MVQALADMNVTAKYLCCGTYHVAAVSSDDELYTWGQNNYNCLGRVTDTEFTADPGHVKVFNVIVDRNPRGKVSTRAVERKVALASVNATVMVGSQYLHVIVDVSLVFAGAVGCLRPRLHHRGNDELRRT